MEYDNFDNEDKKDAQTQKQKLFLHAEALYRYLIEKDDNIDTLILCKNTVVDLVTSDQSLYEAIGSIEDKSTINFNKLVKLLEVTEVVSSKNSLGKERKILTEERVAEIKESVNKAKEKSNK